MTRRDEVLNRVQHLEARTGTGGHIPAHIDISIRAVDSDGNDAGLCSRSIVERHGSTWQARHFTPAIHALDAE